MAIYIPIDLTAYYRPMSLEIEDEINARSLARFQLVDKTGALEVSDGQYVEIYDYNDNLIFAGYTTYPKKINPMQTTALFYDIQAVDIHSLADRYLVAEAYSNVTAGYVVNDIMTKYLAVNGITAGTISDGVTLSVAKFNRRGNVAQTYDELAELCGFIWYIDFDKTLHFKARTSELAGFNVTDTSPILNIDVRQDRSRYRNRQYIRGGTTPTDSAIVAESPSPKPDGVARTFVTRFPISEKPVIRVNSVAVDPNDIGVNGLDGTVTPLKWYWSSGTNTITQDEAETVLSTSDTIEIDYIGLIPLFVVVEDTLAIEERASVENNEGIYEQIEALPNLNNKSQALDIAYGRLSKYTKIERELSYQTYTNGLSAGQLQTVNLSVYDISSGEFLIDRVTMRDLDDNGKFVYDIHAVDGEPFGGWTSFFKSIINRETGVVIDPNETLLVLKSTIEVEAWNESQNVNIFACAVPSTTLYPSVVLYPC